MKKHNLSMIATASTLLLLFPLLLSPASLLAQGRVQHMLSRPGAVAAAAAPVTPTTPEAAGTTKRMVRSALVDGLNLHFERAHTALEKHEPAQAAKELRTAAAFLRLQTILAPSTLRTALATNANEILAMAKEVAARTITTPDRLSGLFTRAQYALANSYQQEAATAWERATLYASSSGYDLTAALANVEQGRIWAGHQPDDGVITAAQQTADALKDGAWSGDQPGQTLAALNKEIERLNGMIQAMVAEEEIMQEDMIPMNELVHPLVKPHSAEMSLQELQELNTFEEDVVPALADEADLHFQVAYDHFNQQEMKAAAQEIRAGVALLALEQGRAAPGHEDVLTQVIKELNATARLLEKGAFHSKDDLVTMFAHAAYAQARHHQLTAAADWRLAQQEVRFAGRDLAGAITLAMDGAHWAGRPGEAPAFKAALTLAGELQQGANFTAGTVAKSIKDVGAEIKADEAAHANAAAASS